MLQLKNVAQCSARALNGVSFTDQKLPPVSYILPDSSKANVGVIGDEHVEKLPILDSKKSNFAILGSVNSNIAPPSFYIDHVDLNIFNIMTTIMNENNLNKSYELPTHKSSENEKRVDYYQKRDVKRFTHLTWVRHRKMKKHQRNKWRKKNLAMIKRRRLERNIIQEKNFRAELLNQIKEAESFDPEAYVKNILFTIDNVAKPETPQQRYQRYMDLIRKNRSNTHLTMPKFDEE